MPLWAKVIVTAIILGWVGLILMAAICFVLRSWKSGVVLISVALVWLSLLLFADFYIAKEFHHRVEEHFAEVVVGMTKAEVRSKIGFAFTENQAVGGRATEWQYYEKTHAVISDQPPYFTFPALIKLDDQSPEPDSIYRVLFDTSGRVSEIHRPKPGH